MLRYILFTVILIFLSQETFAQTHQNESIFIFGQVRTGYYGTYNHNSNIDKDDVHEWRTRIRLGAGYHFSENLSFRTRLAGRYSTEQNQFSFWLDDHLPQRSGIRLGETTIDMFELQWNISDKLGIQAGRFQSNYQLQSFVAKGFHRYDNPNTLISWTDGVLLTWSVTDDLNLEYIGEYNSNNGAGSIANSPLNFAEPASRFSHTLTLLDNKKNGGWLQREIGFHIVPSSFSSDGEFKNYSLFTTRLIHEIPGLNWLSADYSLGVELAFAPNAPEVPAYHDRSNAFGFQGVLSVRNIAEHYNFGILYGYADPGILISPSFRPNSNTYEVRAQRRINSDVSVEIRYRYRTAVYSIEHLPEVQDGDIWARVTYRF